VTIRFELKLQFNFEFCIRREQIIKYSGIYVSLYRILYFITTRFVEMRLVWHRKIFLSLVIPFVHMQAYILNFKARSCSDKWYFVTMGSFVLHC
jgi:hypothetical protein